MTAKVFWVFLSIFLAYLSSTSHMIWGFINVSRSWLSKHSFSLLYIQKISHLYIFPLTSSKSLFQAWNESMHLPFKPTTSWGLTLRTSRTVPPLQSMALLEWVCSLLTPTRMATHWALRTTPARRYATHYSAFHWEFLCLLVVWSQKLLHLLQRQRSRRSHRSWCPAFKALYS